MKEVTAEILEKETYLLYIDTPFCGTCHVAKSMLLQIEAAHEQEFFYHMNASLYPEFMQAAQIESVPCLLIKTNHVISDKVYTFYSVPNMYTHLVNHRPDLFF